MPAPRHPSDQRNLIVAVLLSVALILGWQLLVEAPKRREMARWTVIEAQKKAEAAAEARAKLTSPAEAGTPMTREERLAQSPRIAISSGTLSGSFALKGLRFDDLVLTRYRAELPPTPAMPRQGEPRLTLGKGKVPDRPATPENLVRLLSPAGGEHAYFMQIGWLNSGGRTLKLPDENTLWQADSATLTPGAPVHLRWDDGQGLLFTVTLSLDRNYMFSVAQGVENRTDAPVSLIPYAYINRTYADTGAHTYILHEGPLGVLGGSLKEFSYKDLRSKGRQTFDNTKGWLGITDKYWLTALVPGDTFSAHFDYYKRNGQDRYQADYEGDAMTVAPGATAETHLRFFGGAKELQTLDAYAKGELGGAPIPLFDRAIDFGVFYFLTKPLALFLTWLYRLVGNFGVAIILLTVMVKLLMFPLANKGYLATTKMRALQPEMQRIRDLHMNDRMKMQQEMAALYKREKVNPAAGCLPIIVQIPVFFSLYKVLYVTLEMRQAPFFGWIRDLSAADPSNIFTAFGLVPWTPPVWLHLGLLPLIYGVTMIAQMRLQPAPPDPVQAKMMRIMPYFFTFIMARFPAGLLIYWTCSNLLSIGQQYVINKRHGKPNAPAKPAE